MSGRVVAVGGIAVEETIRRTWLTGQPGAWIGHRHDLRVGGPAALAAIAAARVGATARCVGTVGTDPTGTACRQHLARADVDVTTVLPVPGPTSRILRDADRAFDTGDPLPHDPLYAVLEREDPSGAGDLGDLLVLPGADWGATAEQVDGALGGCHPGDVLLVEWSARANLGPLLDAAYELDLQIVALMSPYAAVSFDVDLRIVDVAVVDTRGAAWLADAGDSAASLCVIVGGQGLSWDGITILAPALTPPTQPPDRAHAVLAGALAGRLACGDDREQAGAAALAARVAYERGVDALGRPGPWPGLRLNLEELG